MHDRRAPFSPLWTLLLAAVYFAASQLGLSMAEVHTSVSPVWPPTGIAIAALLMGGAGLWPGVFVGALVANLLTDVAPHAAAGIAVGNTLEALTAVFLVRRFIDGRDLLGSARNVIRFVLLAGFASTAVSATVGTLVLCASGEVGWDRLFPLWLTWWLGDASGAIVVAPLLLAYGTRRGPDESPAQGWGVRLAALLAIETVVGLVLFTGWTAAGTSHYPIQFLTLPPLLWAALELGPRGVTAATTLLASIAIAGTVNGFGPFARPSANESLLLLQGFVCTISVVFLVLAAAIAERRRVEKANARLYEESQNANRLKDEFLAVVSHELRNPLHSMFGWIRILQEGGLSPADAAGALATVERNAVMQARLIDDLLDVSRIAEGKLTLDLAPLHLAPVVEAAIESFRPAAASSGVELDSEIETEGDLVTGDSARLQQVIGNLLTNAIKFTPRGGAVRVELAATDEAVRIRVHDTGEGIEPDFLPHIFDRFRQADGSMTRRHGGLGLGLAIVRHLVELHGGTVDITSAGRGQGTMVTLRIPRVRPASMES
jgi:signal transduction histidine kinase